MVKAITNSQKVIQLCANVLLSSSPQVSSADTIYYDVDEYRSKYNKLPTRKIIKFNNYDLVKRVVFYNSLAFVRKEVAFLLVSSPFVQVRDANQTLIDCQINPIFKLKDDELSYKQDPQFEVAFIAEIPALGLSTYFIEPASKKNITRFVNTPVRIEVPFDLFLFNFSVKHIYPGLAYIITTVSFQLSVAFMISKRIRPLNFQSKIINCQLRLKTMGY